MNTEETQDEVQRRIAACVNAFEGIPTERIAGKNLGEILAGEMRLHGAGPRADGGFGFEFSGGVCQLLAEAYAEQFKDSGAINYLELLFQHSDIGPLTITMQRVEGLTPAQKLAQAEAQRDALAAENAALTELYRQAVKELDDTCFEMGMMRGEKSMAYPGPETPATDAYLNAVRAEGVEMVKAHPAISLCSLTHVCEEIAAKLRAGKDGE